MIAHRFPIARLLVVMLGLLFCGQGSVAVAAGRWIPEPGTGWWWQLEDVQTLDIGRDVEVFDIDLFEGIDSGKIAELRAAGKRVICYFSAGTLEPWRPDAARFSREALIDGAVLPQFDQETWLAIGDRGVLQAVIEPIMLARLDLAQDAGCDAVEPDNVDGFANAETAGAISRFDQLRYNRWLAEAAHARGLGVGLKNDVEQLQALEPWFDFAVNEQCYGYDDECVAYEATFLANGKAVFNQEYGDGGAGSVSADDYRRLACPTFQRRGISSLWKRTVQLDGQGVDVCAVR